MGEINISPLFTGSGKYRRDEGLDIDREEYERDYTLFAYDLSPDLTEDFADIIVFGIA